MNAWIVASDVNGSINHFVESWGVRAHANKQRWAYIGPTFADNKLNRAVIRRFGFHRKPELRDI